MSLPSCVTETIKYMKDDEVILDRKEWSIKKKLGLISAILCCKQDDWSSISRIMQTEGSEHRRDNSWCSPEKCRKQYASVSVDFKKNVKKDISNLKLQESIIKALRKEREVEIIKLISEENKRIKNLNETLQLLKKGDLNENLEEIENYINNSTQWYKKAEILVKSILDDDNANLFNKTFFLKDKKYKQIIKKIIDLADIKDNLEKRIYTSSDEFETDLMLLFCNAIAYYQYNDIYINIIKSIYKMFEPNLKTLNGNEEERKPKHEPIQTAQPNQFPRWVDRSKYLLDQIYNHVARLEPYMPKRDYNIKIIKKIINLSTLQKNVHSGTYISPYQFVEGVMLLFCNTTACNQYNSKKLLFIKKIYDKISPKLKLICEKKNPANIVDIDESSSESFEKEI